MISKYFVLHLFLFFLLSHPPFRSRQIDQSFGITTNITLLLCLVCAYNCQQRYNTIRQPATHTMMRRFIHNNIATAVVIIIFATGVWPVASQPKETTRLRCQKSGCREGGAADKEPTLIVARSPPTKVLPFIITWIVAFLVLRLAAISLRKLFNLLPIACEKLPKIGAALGHYCNSFFLISARIIFKGKGSERKVKSGRSLPSRTSNRSLGSLADLLDDSSRDSSSVGYSSAYSTTSSEGDSNDDDKSSALESQSEIASSGLSSSDSSADSTYDYNHNNNDDDQSKGRESIVSKFLNYISVSNPEEFDEQYTPPRTKNGRVKRRPTLDHKLRHSHNTVGIYTQSQSGSRTRRLKRRSTVGEANYPSYLTQIATLESKHQRRATAESSNQGRESSNAPEPILVTQRKTSSGRVKMRKAPPAADAAKTKGQNHGSNDNNGKNKSSKRQQQQNQQHPMQRHDKEKLQKNSSLHHHLSKFSSSNEGDNENNSTMLSTLDLRSRATPDTRATWDSGSFVGK